MAAATNLVVKFGRPCQSLLILKTAGFKMLSSAFQVKCRRSEMSTFSMPQDMSFYVNQNNFKKSLHTTQNLFEDIQTSSSQCWNCNTQYSILNTLHCPHCNVLQAAPSRQKIDYFELMEVHPKSFKIDVRKLASRYKQLQRVLHPDRYIDN
jgi:hypothetical protein